jgi:co-chaperonin GroES (HSP10)
MKIIPIGSRIFVELITPVDEVTARMTAAGLHAVVLDENVPRPTEGRVIAVGSDPMTQELIQINDVVSFSKYAGHELMVEGRTYRSLELREIIACIRPDPPTTTDLSEHQSEPVPEPE